MDIPILQVALKTDQDLILARQRTKEVAMKAGLTQQDQTRLITAVSELARNAVMYAGGGRLKLSITSRDSQQYVQAVISDSGRGIKNLDAIFDETYNSKTGVGKGIAGSRRIVDLFDIKTSDQTGTTVTVGKLIPPLGEAITAKAVAAWMRTFTLDPAPDLMAQLQEQNHQLMQTLEELQQNSDALRQASKHKGEFLANMSHEIRSPLNALLGLNNILGRTNLDEEQRRLLSLSREAGKSLLALINDILDLSKIEAGKMKLESVEFDVRHLTSTTIEIFSVQAHEKGLKLDLSTEDLVPPYVVGDETRVRQVLVNLVSNAIKFSESGPIKVTVSAISADGELNRIRFSVTDSGPGISPAAQKSLFQSFTQLDGSLTRKHGGTGLGLSISKSLVQLMNGEIGVTSAVGKGSQFWFELPLAITPQRGSGSGADLLPSGDVSFVDTLTNKLVLVVEDQAVNQLVASMELHELGLDVHVANNGREALDLVTHNNYALVFMDCQMPVMDGFAASRNIREGGITVPIIAMTAHALDGDRERCFEAGMNDYISKPFEADDLRRVVSRWLKSQEKARAINKDKLTARYNGSKLSRLLTAFQEDLPLSADKIKHFTEDGRLDEAAAVAHAFKSGCRMVFADKLADLVDEIEAACKDQQAHSLSELLAQFDQQVRLVAQECGQLLNAEIASR